VADSTEGPGEEKLEQAVKDLGLSDVDRGRAIELAKFLIRAGSLDVSRAPTRARAGDTICASSC